MGYLGRLRSALCLSVFALLIRSLEHYLIEKMVGHIWPEAEHRVCQDRANPLVLSETPGLILMVTYLLDHVQGTEDSTRTWFKSLNPGSSSSYFAAEEQHFKPEASVYNVTFLSLLIPVCVKYKETTKWPNKKKRNIDNLQPICEGWLLSKSQDCEFIRVL